MLNVAEIVAALRSIRPGAQWVLRGVDLSNIEWNDQFQSKPSESEILQEIERLKSLGVNFTYAEDRVREYPSISDQLDMLWHAMDSDSNKRLEPFYSIIKTVKQKYPKA